MGASNFEGAWKEILSVNPNISHFHMTDFASSREGWESWEGESQKRAQLISDLLNCIKKNTNKGFALSIGQQDYDTANREFALAEELGSRYALASIAILGRLRKWADRKNIKFRKQLSIIFEDGDAGWGQLLKVARNEGFNASQESKAGIRAFDACDLVAWITRRSIHDLYVKELHLQGPTERKQIVQSFSRVKPTLQDMGRLSLAGMRNICRDLKVPKR